MLRWALLAPIAVAAVADLVEDAMLLCLAAGWIEPGITTVLGGATRLKLALLPLAFAALAGTLVVTLVRSALRAAARLQVRYSALIRT